MYNRRLHLKPPGDYTHAEQKGCLQKGFEEESCEKAVAQESRAEKGGFEEEDEKEGQQENLEKDGQKDIDGEKAEQEEG